jgi:putative ABC transport system permease protein
LIASYDSVSPDYFRAMGIPIVKGRAFIEQDKKGALPVAVVSETMAHRFFGGEDPIGLHIRRGDSEDNKPWMTIIGIAGDVRRYGLAERLRPEIYFPYLQQPQAAMALVVRTAADPLSITPAVRREVLAVDKDQPVYDIKTLNSLLARSIASNRLSVWLLGLFAALALLLASIGIYGVIAYTVTQRTHEIGIRMALGAQPRDMLRLVLGQGMTLALIGIAIGLIAAFALTRAMASLLFTVSPTDPLTFVGISVLLGIVAFLACYIPARRATKVDPMVALRHE